VIVGAESFSCLEIAELSHRGRSIGRLSADLNIVPAVDPTVESCLIFFQHPVKKALAQTGHRQ
jgi:hypothetical protein